MSHHEPPLQQPNTLSVDSSADRLRQVREFAWQELGFRSHSVALHMNLGTKRISRDEQRLLRKGQVVTLDNRVDEPVEIMAGTDVLGYGRVVIVDGKFAVQITELRNQARRRSA